MSQSHVAVEGREVMEVAAAKLIDCAKMIVESSFATADTRITWNSLHESAKARCIGKSHSTHLLCVYLDEVGRYLFKTDTESRNSIYAGAYLS